MEFVMLGLFGLLDLISAVCFIIILVSAFQDEIIEGVFCFFCFLYFIYYAGWKFDHDKRALIVVGCFGPIFLHILIMAVISYVAI